jgi:hypothetical protein
MFTIRFDVMSEARCSASKGLMIVVTTEKSPRHDVIGSNDGKRPSQPDESVTPPKLASANSVESLAIYPF